MNPVFGRALNIWLDEASDFIAEYKEHQEMYYITKTIVGLLRNGLDLNADDPMHPFNKYADPDKSFGQCLRAFANDVMNAIHNSSMRGYVHSFFHSGGSNYDEMHDFFGLFQEFAFDATYQNESDDESDSESTFIQCEFIR
jgi:hypothetical protein